MAGGLVGWTELDRIELAQMVLMYYFVFRFVDLLMCLFPFSVQLILPP